MTRPQARRVHIFLWSDTTRSAQERRWVADVDRPDGTTLHSTTWNATKDEAIDDAMVWAAEHGYEVVPHSA